MNVLDVASKDPVAVAIVVGAVTIAALLTLWRGGSMGLRMAGIVLRLTARKREQARASTIVGRNANIKSSRIGTITGVDANSDSRTDAVSVLENATVENSDIDQVSGRSGRPSKQGEQGS